MIHIESIAGLQILFVLLKWNERLLTVALAIQYNTYIGDDKLLQSESIHHYTVKAA